MAGIAVDAIAAPKKAVKAARRKHAKTR